MASMPCHRNIDHGDIIVITSFLLPQIQEFTNTYHHNTTIPQRGITVTSS